MEKLLEGLRWRVQQRVGRLGQGRPTPTPRSRKQDAERPEEGRLRSRGDSSSIVSAARALGSGRRGRSMSVCTSASLPFLLRVWSVVVSAPPSW